MMATCLILDDMIGSPLMISSFAVLDSQRATADRPYAIDAYLFAGKFAFEFSKKPFALELVQDALIDEAAQVGVDFSPSRFALDDFDHVLYAAPADPRRKRKNVV